MSQTQKINRFSEASQKLLQDMGQTEIFELCENSTKLQCSDWNSFTEIGIIYCGCGRNLKYKRSTTTKQKEDYDYTTIPGYINKKNSCRGRKYVPSDNCLADEDTESRWDSSVSEKKKSGCTTKSLWRDTAFQLRMLNEYKFKALGYLDKC